MQFNSQEKDIIVSQIFLLLFSLCHIILPFYLPCFFLMCTLNTFCWYLFLFIDFSKNKNLSLLKFLPFFFYGKSVIYLYQCLRTTTKWPSLCNYEMSPVLAKYTKKEEVSQNSEASIKGARILILNKWHFQMISNSTILKIAYINEFYYFIVR